MLTLRSSAHIRTSRNIKGLHACSTSTGFSLFHLHAWHMSRESAALKNRELHRALIAHLWNEHMERCRREYSPVAFHRTKAICKPGSEENRR